MEKSVDALRLELDETKAELARLQAEVDRLKSIEFEHAQTLTIIDQFDDAIISEDLSGSITSWNKGAERIFGYQAREVIGSAITILMPPDHINEERALLDRIKQGEQVEQSFTIRRRKNGQLINISLTITPIKDVAGNIIGVSRIAKDVTEQQQYFINMQRLAAIVEGSDDAVFSKDLNGIIQSWNKGAERMFGYQAHEVIGKPISILIPEERLDEEPAILDRLKRGERIDHYETIRRRKDGKLLDISLTISPVRDATDQIIGASKIARDITLQKQIDKQRTELLEREKEARIQAEEANRLKDEFLATVSHELRTPLTSMLGWVRLLLNGSLDDTTAIKALETIDRNVKSQAQLIEDLLDISRITTGKLRLELQPINIAGVVNAAVDAVRPVAEVKNIRIQTILDSSVGVVRGDFERLQQIVWNLLSNAIKFTGHGGKVQIEIEPKENQVFINVKDNGKGIEAEFLPHVFEQFRQANSSITRHHGGLGMGLAIVKRLTELHGGSVSAASEGLDKGATFTVMLPALTNHKKVEDSHNLYNRSTGKTKLECPSLISGMMILVVDDEPDTCAVLRTIFEQCGAKVKTASSVDEAISILDEWHPTVLVSDIGMPGQDGYDLIRKVRARKAEEGGKIPAIALTAFARIEDRIKALTEGYQMHVPKPVEPTELLTIVASLTAVIEQRESHP